MGNNKARSQLRLAASPGIHELNDIADMIESGLEDFEIINELGITNSELKSLLYKSDDI